MNISRNLKKRIAVASGAAAGAVLLASVAFAQSVGTAPSCSLTATPSSITAGQSSMLSWTSSNASQASIDQSIGSLGAAAGGAISVSPTTTATYTGSFGGGNGTSTCAATVYVTPATTLASSAVAPVSPMNAPIPTASASVSNTSSASVTPVTYPAPSSTPAPMVTQVDASGNVLIRGSVQSVGTNSITINGWGGVWIVRTSGSTSIMSSSGDTSSIHTGDFVGVQGTVAQDQIYTVDAAVVRDWTTNPATVASASSASAGSSSSGATQTTSAPSGGTSY